MLTPEDVKLCDQEARLITDPKTIDREAPAILAYAARICTGTESDDIFTAPPESHYPLLERIMNSKHMSVYEHYSVSMLFTTNRAISHQLVRHRLAAYTQQSMRYVKFTSTRGKDQLYMIKPFNYDDWTEEAKRVWKESVINSALSYDALIDKGIKAEDARGVLPQDTRTQLFATWNIRQLLHVLYDDACGRFINKHAQPQIRKLMAQLAKDIVTKSNFLRFVFDCVTDNNNKLKPTTNN